MRGAYREFVMCASDKVHFGFLLLFYFYQRALLPNRDPILLLSINIHLLEYIFSHYSRPYQRSGRAPKTRIPKLSCHRSSLSLFFRFFSSFEEHFAPTLVKFVRSEGLR